MSHDLFFLDKDGHKRTETRTKWWLNANGLAYNDYFFHQTKELDGQQIKAGEVFDNRFYPEEDVPVFFGHYWLQGEPELQSPNAVCLDYSIAKNGKLVAYRFNGEPKLSKENLWVV